MSYIRRNSVRLNVTRYNNDAVILNINVINDRLWRRSVDYRNGTLTFHVIVEDLETGNMLKKWENRTVYLLNLNLICTIQLGH